MKKSLNPNHGACGCMSLSPRTEFMWCQRRNGHKGKCNFGRKRPLLIDLLSHLI